MREQKIAVLERQISRFPKWIPNNWYDKVLLWLAKRRGYDLEGELVKYNEVVISPTKLHESVMRHAYEVQNTTGRRAKYLFCGNDFFLKFASAPMPDLHRIEFVPDGSRMKYYGMIVIVVPYIEGFFCLPDIEEIR